MGTDVKDLLRGLVAGIEGTAGASLVRMDGTAVETLRVDQGFALDEVAQEGSVAGKVLDYLCQKVDGGALDHIMLVAERYIIILAMAIVAIIRLARRDDGDRRSFILAIGAALLLSPILWLHYLVLLLVPFALVRPKLSLLWLSPLVLWVTPHYAAAGDIWRIVVVLGFIAVAFSVALRASPGPRLSAR